jgi:hypothetical protein
MASTYIDGSLLKVFLTSTGYIALCSNQLGKDDETCLFGTNGSVPPVSFDELIKDMLLATKIEFTKDDVRDLNILIKRLRASADLIETSLAL